MRTRWMHAILPAALVLLCLLIAGASMLAAEKTLLSLNYKGADLRDVLNTLAAQAGVSVSMDETVAGTVSLHLENVTFEECLATLAVMFRLYVTRQDRVYIITRQLVGVTKEAEDLYSLELQEARLAAVLAELTRVAGITLTPIGVPPVPRLSLILNRLSLSETIDLLAEAYHCQVERRKDTYVFRPAAESGKMSIQFAEGRLGVDLAGVPLSALVRELSVKTSLAVLCDQAASQVQVTAFFAPLPLGDALSALAAANGLRLYEENGVYRFGRGGETIGTIRLRNGLLTLDVRNVELGEVLAELSRQGSLTILAEPGTSGRVSGTVMEEEFQPGLAAFLEANSFQLEWDAKTYRVSRMNPSQSVLVSVNADGTVNLDVANSSLSSAVTELTKKKGFGVVVYANVNWTINSVHLIEVEFEEALTRLLAGTTFTYKREGDTYLVGEGVNYRQGDTDFLDTELLPLHNVQAETIWNTLPTSFPRQNIVLLKESNALLINGTPKLIAALKSYLAKVDIMPEGTETEVIRLQHLKAEEALKLLPPSYPKSDITILPQLNGLAVTGSEGYRQRIRECLAQFDIAPPMILFDVLVLQFSTNESRGGGLKSLKIEAGGQTVTWELGSFVGTIISPNTPAAMQLSASITAAISDGRAKVRANPKIATLSGTPARFDVVTKYNYSWPMPSTTSGGQGGTQTEYKNFQIDSGIQITLTPWVSASKEITLELKPRISQYASSPTVGGNVTALPGVMERSTESTVRIMDGYTVVISGFTQESEEIEEARFPLLGQIPILGALFKFTKKTKRQDEFVIVITPRLIEDPAEINALMATLSGEGSTSEPIAIDLDDKKR